MIKFGRFSFAHMLISIVEKLLAVARNTNKRKLKCIIYYNKYIYVMSEIDIRSYIASCSGKILHSKVLLIKHDKNKAK